MEALMEQKQGGVTENYLYLDPKVSNSDAGAPKSKTSQDTLYLWGPGMIVARDAVTPY